MLLELRQFYGDLLALPYWANVALAARTASRLPRRFLVELKGLSEADADLLHDAVVTATQAAARAQHIDATHLSLGAKQVARRLQGPLKPVGANPKDGDLFNMSMFVAAIGTMCAAITEPRDTANMVVHVTSQVLNQAYESSSVVLAEFQTAVERDLRRLRQAATDGQWSEASPVEQKVFGELWLDGAPNLMLASRRREERVNDLVGTDSNSDQRKRSPKPKRVGTIKPTSKSRSAGSIDSKPGRRSAAKRPSLDKLRANKPTKRWRESMGDGDANFTKAALRDADAALNAFLTALAKLGAKPAADDALPLVKQVVERFNAINEGHGPVVETSEREELCEFFNEALRAVGIEFDHDVTEEWREW